MDNKMETYIISHSYHEETYTDHYVVRARKKPTIEEVVAVLSIDFAPDDDHLHIEEVKVVTIH